jgi:TonB-dependent starch-binding outer membrane protein SusC
MKITAAILLVACLQVAARTSGQTVTLSVKNVPVKQVFKEIQKQTGLNILVKESLIKHAAPVTLSVKDAPVTDVLQLCLKNLPLTYSIEGGVIVIKEKQSAAFQPADPFLNNQPSLIDTKGRILNEKGEPVVASVVVKGTKKGTSTNDNGEFELKGVEDNAILVITGISIETLEVKVNGRNDLALISAKTKTTSMDEVQVGVNTGYQKISKERFVGAYSQLDSAAYNRRAGMDIINRLDGTMNGILFDKKSANPFINLQIRGLSTISNLAQSASSTPLIIVDNFPFKQDLSLLNPNDVETVTILKDAAATSIWGAQAGNGVIVIATKKGVYNQPMKISVSSNLTIENKPDLYYYPQMGISDFIDAEISLFNKGVYDANLANTTEWPRISPVVEVLAKKRAGKISDLEAGEQLNALKSMDLRHDLNEFVYRPSVLQQHYIRVNGGSNLLNYSLAGGYNRNLNNIQHSKPNDQFTLNSNLSLRPIKNFEVTSAINYIRSIQRSTDLFLPEIYPYAQLADAEGKSLAIPYDKRIAYLDTAGAGQLLDWKYYPLEEIRNYDANNTARLIGLNLGLSYKFTNWLDLKINYNYSDQFDNGRTFYSLATFYTRDLINKYTNLSASNPNLQHPVPVGGILDLMSFQSISQNARGQLNFNKTFSNDHSITAMAASEISETKKKIEGGRFYGYNPDIGTYNSRIDYVTPYPIYGGRLGTQLVPNSNRLFPSTNNRFVSFLGNVSYTYRKLITVYGSARKDGSNNFGVNANRKWKPLWSAGASVDISNTSFLRNVTFINFLRLRSSYGYSGNPGNGTGLSTIQYGGSPTTVTNIANWASPNDPPNPDLAWEKVRTINNGIDFGLFNNRLTGSIDVYQKKSTDIISLHPLQPSTGVNSVITNAASLKGHGFEVKLNSKNIVGPLSWQTGFMLTHSTTRVTKLFRFAPPATRDFVGYGLFPFEGGIAFGIASYKWAGLDPLTGDPRGYVGKNISTDYQAISNDSLKNQSYYGSAIPLYYGNISNSFSWRKFTLSALITYRLDFYFRKPTISYNNLVNGWRGNADYAARWQKPGDEKFTNVPSFTFPINSDRDAFYQNSDVNLLRGDNVRLQDIRLEYDCTIRTSKKTTAIGLTTFIYVNNLNLILWRKNKSNLDPDFTGGAGFILPNPVTWTIGANLNL